MKEKTGTTDNGQEKITIYKGRQNIRGDKSGLTVVASPDDPLVNGKNGGAVVDILAEVLRRNTSIFAQWNPETNRFDTT